MTKEEKKKYVDAYNKLVDLVKDGYLKKEPFDQAIRDLLFDIISKFDKEINELDTRYYLRDAWIDEIIDKYKQKVRNKE